MTNSKPTHSELVDIAVRWLASHRRCSIVFAELACASELGLIPDAIGWHGQWSVLVECKTSRADFLADRRKPIHIAGMAAPGQERWYLAPQGVLTLQDMPDGWLLAEWTGSRVRVVSQQPHGTRSTRYAHILHQDRQAAEMPFLISACRRMLSGQKCVGGRFGDKNQSETP